MGIAESVTIYLTSSVKGGVEFRLEIHNGNLTLMPVIDDIQAAFDLLKATKSVSLKGMDETVRQEAKNQHGQC